MTTTVFLRSGMMGNYHVPFCRAVEGATPSLTLIVVVYEDLKIKNLVKNHCQSKSINDAGWYQFRVWLEYFGKVFGRATVAVNPAYTSAECSNCGIVVKKSLSTRTHICQCGCVLDRDENAALNILNKGLSTLGQSGTFALFGASNASGELTSILVGENLLG